VSLTDTYRKHGSSCQSQTVQTYDNERLTDVDNADTLSLCGLLLYRYLITFECRRADWSAVTDAGVITRKNVTLYVCRYSAGTCAYLLVHTRAQSVMKCHHRNQHAVFFHSTSRKPATWLATIIMTTATWQSDSLSRKTTAYKPPQKPASHSIHTEIIVYWLLSSIDFII